MGCCDGFFARACAAMPIAMVFMLAALSQIPADEGSRVVMVTRNSHLELKDLVSSFGPRVPTDGLAGTLRLAVPLEACEPLRNNVGGGPWVALVQRGGEDGPTGCSFVTKVRTPRARAWPTATNADGDLPRRILSISFLSRNVEV